MLHGQCSVFLCVWWGQGKREGGEKREGKKEGGKDVGNGGKKRECVAIIFLNKVKISTLKQNEFYFSLSNLVLQSSSQITIP